MLLQRVLKIPFFFVIEENAARRIAEILSDHNLVFHRPVWVAGGSSTAEIAASLNLAQSVAAVKAMSVTANTYDEVRRLRMEIVRHRSDLVVAVGGGKVLDVAKMASYEEGVPFVAIPTTLSNDGVASPVAVIRRAPDGVHESLGAHMPLGVIVDLGLVRQAPAATIQAGVGDLVSNLSALEDWRDAHSATGERIDTLAMLLAHMAAEIVVQYVRNQSGPVDIREDSFLSRLGEGLIMSGLAMEIAGSSRPCSGAEHLISHALDRLLPDPRPHGLQVGVATLNVERLRGRDPASLVEMFEKLGMPQTFEDLGIDAGVVAEAIRMAPNMRPTRYTILSTLSTANPLALQMR